MQDAKERWLRDQYAAALRQYLADAGGEAALQRAYELGRRAIGDGIGVLELVALHQDVLDGILRERKEPESCVNAVSDAGRFVAESLSPFEMTHRGFREGVAALRRLNEMLEEEVKRIAHALHDEAVSGGLPPRARERLGKIRGPLDEIEKHLRRLSHELRPTVLDDLGLLPALEFLAQGVIARSGVPITVDGPRSPRLPSSVEITLYRVVQEALRNATKHAGARRVGIRVAVEAEMVRCLIKDDGRGFDVVAVLDRKGERGLGLIGMRERVNAVSGQLTIESAPGRGTELRITIPLGEHDADTNPSGR